MEIHEAIQIMDGATREDFLYMYDKEDRPHLIATAENLAVSALIEVQELRKMGVTLDEVRYLKLKRHTHENCRNLTCRLECEQDGYNEAVDEFSQHLKNVLGSDCYPVVDKISEAMKNKKISRRLSTKGQKEL